MSGSSHAWLASTNLDECTGNNRLAFAPDGSLWTGQIAYGWSGDIGIQRIVFNARAPMDVYTMKLSHDGFELTFTQPVNKAEASNPDNYKFRHYFYKYQRKVKHEGADNTMQQDLQEVPVTGISISASLIKTKQSRIISSLPLISLLSLRSK